MLVLIGVAGEIICDWKEMGVGRLARAKRISAILLVVGLMMEFWEAAKSDIQAEQLMKGNLVLQTNVASLNGAVIQLAHQYDLSTNALAEANARLAQAHSEANELEYKLKPRTITQSQHDDFVRFLTNVPNKPSTTNTWVICSNPSGETTAFVMQIRKMLDDAGYGANSDCPLRDGLVNGMNGSGVFNSWSMSMPLPPNISIGIMVPSDLSQDKWPPQAFALFGAFSEAHLIPTFFTFPSSQLESNSTAVFVPSK